MKKLLLAMAGLLLGIAGAHSQAPVKIYTSPKLPARDALTRMNLTLAWNTRVTIDGNRDGIASVQIIPGKPSQLVVQTFKGAVYLYDADNGDLVWKTTVGVPYWTSQPAGFNAHSIFVTRRNMLHILNRKDGTQRVYTYDPATKGNLYGYELAFTPIAAPVADEDFLYVPMGNRLHALLIPDFETVDKTRLAREARKAAGKEDPLVEDAKIEKLKLEDQNLDGPDSPQPIFYWGYALGDQITTTSPLVYGDQLSLLATDGTLTSVNRFERGPRVENFEFTPGGRVASGAGQHLHIAYLASDDFNLYAVDMKSGGLIWRYAGGAHLQQQPHVNDRDIYIAPERMGLRRIDREKGREVWANRDASRFLAANLNNVYALDRVGKFYVLDARRGTTLAKLDLSDWTIPVANEWTDRTYLAANDGQIMCLRHRELTAALNLKTMDLPAPKVKEEKKPMEENKKEEEKEKEKEKEKDKEKVKDKDKDKDKDKEKDKDKDKEKDKEKDKAAAMIEWMHLTTPQIQFAARLEDVSLVRPEVIRWDRRRMWDAR